MMMKGGYLKKLIRLVAVTYLLYLLYANFVSLRLDEHSSAIGSSLSEFGQGISPTTRRRIIANVHTRERVEQLETSRSFEDYNNPLNRDLSRIPAYFKGSNNSLFGYVMRDLSNRFLHPSSPQQKRQRLNRWYSSPSNVLVVCPRANEFLSEVRDKNVTTITSKKKLVKSFGYRIGESFLVESTFYGHNTIGVDSNTGIMDYHSTNITDIMLAIFDPGQGQEDSVISSHLKEYIQTGTLQFAIFRISSAFSSEDLINESDNVEMRGIDTSKTFLDAGYKLQVLSSSHAPINGLNPYGPNTLLKSADEIKGFLRFGASLVRSTSDIHSTERRLNNSKMADTPAIFHSILFATRGLDLAIPSRKAFLNVTKYGSDFVLNIKKDGIPYQNCSAPEVAWPLSEKVSTTLRFRGDDLDLKNDKFHGKGDEVVMSCFEREISMDDVLRGRIDDRDDTIFVELWHSHKNISLSEAACLKCTKSEVNDATKNTVEHACTNRILEIGRPELSNQTWNRTRRPNLLAIELKGVNREMMDSSLHHFKWFLKYQKFSLEYFPNFVLSKSFSNTSDFESWWRNWGDDSTENGSYQRYRGSNQCDPHFDEKDSNPMPYHGSQIGGMFCFDYDRPNCLGGKHAAFHLFDHVKKFIKLNRNKKQGWASYITLIDGVEETETLVGTLDLPLRYLLSTLKDEMSNDEWSNTLITIFSSDVEDPVLFLKGNKNDTMLLAERKTLSTSELHHIIRSMMNNIKMEELVHKDLPLEYIDTPNHSVEASNRHDNLFNSDQIAPPSILSFYADIPKEQKFQLIETYPERPKRAVVVRGCKCATNLFSWIQCAQHPWDATERDSDRETYILVDCPGKPLHLEIRVVRNDNLVRRSIRKKRESASTHLGDVNIMFLELDSVSVEYADRHFPKTRELLKRYQIKKKNNDEYECIHGICSAEFRYTSLVGANSIPNQVAALSGCISSSTKELCGLVNATPGDICNDADVMHHGLQLERLRNVSKMAYWCPERDVEITKTPWLFGISDSKGYINFFGEEFCYDYSPYVTQGTFTSYQTEL